MPRKGKKKQAPAPEEYFVEKILESKIEKGVELFLVKWEGYDLNECTWEPRSHLGNARKLLEEYERNQKSKNEGPRKEPEGKKRDSQKERGSQKSEKSGEKGRDKGNKEKSEERKDQEPQRVAEEVKRDSEIKGQRNIGQVQEERRGGSQKDANKDQKLKEITNGMGSNQIAMEGKPEINQGEDQGKLIEVSVLKEVYQEKRNDDMEKVADGMEELEKYFESMTKGDGAEKQGEINEVVQKSTMESSLMHETAPNTSKNNEQQFESHLFQFGDIDVPKTVTVRPLKELILEKLPHNEGRPESKPNQIMEETPKNMEKQKNIQEEELIDHKEKMDEEKPNVEPPAPVNNFEKNITEQPIGSFTKKNEPNPIIEENPAAHTDNDENIAITSPKEKQETTPDQKKRKKRKPIQIASPDSEESLKALDIDKPRALRSQDEPKQLSPPMPIPSSQKRPPVSNSQPKMSPSKRKKALRESQKASQSKESNALSIENSSSRFSEEYESNSPKEKIKLGKKTSKSSQKAEKRVKKSEFPRKGIPGIDTPEKITNFQVDSGNQMSFEIRWKKKYGGSRPKPVYLTNEEVKNFFPRILCDFYETKLKFETI